MKKLIVTLSILLTVAGVPGCLIDDSPVASNTYSIGKIEPQVNPENDASVSTTEAVKKVYVGHDFPINIELTAQYEDTELPLQYYLLNVDDVAEVEKGICSESDIRTYYCERSTLTTVKTVKSGKSTYGSVISIPADSAIDTLTGHYKTGTYYVVADANKYDSAEPDAMEIYRRSKDKISASNKIVITTEFMNRPDLSIEALNFTGGDTSPRDVVVFYNLDLSSLPGAATALGADKLTFFIPPSKTDRYFTGTVSVRSSSCDSLNVPIEFYLEDTAKTIKIPLKVYDEELKAYQSIYYIPLLKANITTTLSLGLLIPDDTGTLDYFSQSNYDSFPALPDATMLKNYPLSALRHALPKIPSSDADYTDFHIVAEVNKSGSIKESRFVVPNSDDKEYTTTDYISTGGVNSTTTLANNTKSQTLQIKIETMDVDANKGIQVYPYYKMSTKDDAYKNLVIFWDGFGLNVGDNMFGATAEMHEGMYFQNYSQYSLGIDIHGTLFKNNLYLINTYLNAESHPFNQFTSGFDFHVEAVGKVYLSEAGDGFSENTYEYPILLASGEKTVEKWIYFIKAKLTAGFEIHFTPGVDINVNEDGSLKISKFANIRGSVYADASASIADIATIGLYTYLDVLTIEFRQNCFTTVEYDKTNYPGQVRGSLNRNAGLYLKGPSGYINGYFEINFILFTKRWEKELFRFSSFVVPIFEVDFAGSGTMTTWQKVEDASLIKYPESSVSGSRL